MVQNKLDEFNELPTYDISCAGVRLCFKRLSRMGKMDTLTRDILLDFSSFLGHRLARTRVGGGQTLRPGRA